MLIVSAYNGVLVLTVLTNSETT